MWLWFVLLGAPFFVGATLCAGLPRSRRSTQALMTLGVAFGLGFVLFAYFVPPASDPLYNAYEPCGPSVCESYLGRWWAPDFAVLFAAMGYTAWLAGVCAGAQVHRLPPQLGRSPLA